MRSIRNFAYAAVLTLSIFAVQPTPGAAEEVRGAFTLSHEVHFQKWVLRPGDHAFSVKNAGSSHFIALSGINGTHAHVMLMVNDVETPKPDESNQLVLVSRNGQSFLSATTLPNRDMTLRFAVPRERRAK